MKRRYIAVLVLALAVAGIAAYAFFGYPLLGGADGVEYVDTPPEFNTSVYASDSLGGSSLFTPGPSPGPRLIVFHDGVPYVSLPDQGRVVALPDQDGNGEPDQVVTVADGLNRPHGMAFHNNQIYIANEDSVVRYGLDGMRTAQGSKETVVDDLPTGGHHWTRTIQVRDGSLFISVGSSCDACEETDPRRAAITQCSLDGENCETYAEGIRNAVGFVFHDGQLVATENGRDGLGPNTPPDEILTVEEGKHYGWPYCYGDQTSDPKFANDAFCSQTEPADVNLQAHSAPLGLAFATAESWPEEYRGDLYVAYHGSWDREPPTGYKIVRIPYENGQFGEPQDFATGWLANDGTVHGRPVDVAFGSDDAMYVTDDSSGRIYRITYTGN